MFELKLIEHYFMILIINESLINKYLFLIACDVRN